MGLTEARLWAEAVICNSEARGLDIRAVAEYKYNRLFLVFRRGVGSAGWYDRVVVPYEEVSRFAELTETITGMLESLLDKGIAKLHDELSVTDAKLHECLDEVLNILTDLGTDACPSHKVPEARADYLSRVVSICILNTRDHWSQTIYYSPLESSPTAELRERIKLLLQDVAA